MKPVKLLAIVLVLAITFSLFGCIPGTIMPETKVIDTSYFSVYSLSEVSHNGERSARVSILSDISIVCYWLTVSLIGKDGGVILTHDDAKNEIVEAGATFSVYIPLGEIPFDNIVKAELDGTATTEDVSGKYLSESAPRVTFMCENIKWAKQSAKAGQPVPCPDTPTLPEKTFEGWYKDKELCEPFDFASGIREDVIAYAKLTDDVGKIVNRITKELVPSLVTVRATYTEDKLWNPSTAESISSGVIIRRGPVSYILTNRHGTALLEGYKKIEIEVEDCYGKIYPAAVVKVGDELASDAAYDLAILAVSGMSENLCAVELASENPAVGERVFSLGTPAGQQNAITVGRITDFLNVKLDADAYLTNVEFGVLAHNAEVRRGSSGGALINSDLQLVGINFAGKGGDDFSEGYAIPINKVREFIERYM